jgi:hypothetical protein
MPNKSGITLTFEVEKETKNTVRFTEALGDGQPAVVGTLYVQKFAIQKLGNPSSLTVTIAGA